jgi:hypothetical protein
MQFGSRIDDRPNPVFFCERKAVKEANFVSVDTVPFRGTVGIIIRLKAGVPGGFGKKYRGNFRFFSDKKVKSAIYTLLNTEIPRINRQFLGKNPCGAEQNASNYKNTALCHTFLLSDF